MRFSFCFSNPVRGPGQIEIFSTSSRTHLVALAVVELRGAGRGVVGHRGGVFERAAVFQVRGDAGRPKGVITNSGRDVGAGGALFVNVARPL